MKSKRVTQFLFMLVMIFAFIMMNGNMVQADSTDYYYSYEFFELQGVDESKITTLDVGQTYDSENKNIQIVTKNQKVSFVNFETGEELVESMSTVSAAGILYKVTVPVNEKAYVIAYCDTNTDIYYSSDNTTIEYVQFANYSSNVNNGKCFLNFTNYYSDDMTVYIWIENGNDDMTLEVGSGSMTEVDYIEKHKDEYMVQNSDQVYVYSWNAEVGTKLEKFYKKYPEYKNKVIFCNLGVSGNSDEYTKIVKSLAWDKNNNTSIVAMDESITKSMLATQNFVSIKSLGLEDDYANAYDFTKKQGSYNGTLYLTSWQACPANFIYNSDIAKKVLGTSDPIKVQEMIKTPEKFLAVAKKMKAAGYYMTTGIDTLYYSEQENIDYVTSLDYINLEKAKSLSATMTKNGYDTGHYTWSDDWSKDLTGNKVFGVFGTTWFSTWSLEEDSELYKNGQICAGPLTYSWGGSYLGVTNQNKNQKLAALVIEALCCDEEVMTNISKEDIDFVNNKVVNLQLAANAKSYSNQTKSAYNGQNLYDVSNQIALAVGNEDHISLTKPLKKNSTIKVGKVTYKINNLSKTAVTYTKTSAKTSTVKIPDTVTINDVEYKVTEIGASALKNNKKVTKLTVGKNVTTIGKEAFRGCTKLKSVDVKSTTLKKIGASAFYGDKKLTKITLKTTKLTKNSVGKNALKGTNKKLTIKVPSKKVSTYKKYFKNKGNKTVKVKK